MPRNHPNEHFEEEARGSAEKNLLVINKAATAAGIPFESMYTISAAPWKAIIEAAKKRRCDLIVMGSHGRGALAGAVLGSQTSRVMTYSKIPVLVIR